MGWIEIVATVFGLACVILYMFRNVWAWPTGLVQVVLYCYIFYEVKLYSDLILHVIYVGLQLYGWYHWLYGGARRDSLPVRVLAPRTLAGWAALGLVGTLLWGTLMARYTDAALPYPDAFTTVLSLIAQWLLARKVLESWLFWIVVDVAAIGIYLVKGLYFTSGLYAAFLVLATLGFLQWRRTLIPAAAAQPA